MAVLDPQGVIVSVNEVWKRIAETGGLALSNYGIGSSYFDYWPLRAGEAAQHQLHAVLKGGTTVFTWLYPCEMRQLYT